MTKQLIERLQTLREIVAGDKNFGRATRADEQKRLQQAAEQAFRAPGNRDRSRAQIEAALRTQPEFAPADLKAEVFPLIQRRRREVTEAVTAARLESKRLRRVRVPNVELDQREAMSDFGIQAVVRALKRMDQRALRAEVRAEFAAMPPAGVLDAVAADVSAVQQIDAELALPFPVKPDSTAAKAILEAWHESVERRAALREERAALQTRIATASEVIERARPSLDGLEPEAMLRVTDEYNELPAKLEAAVAPILTREIAEAEALETAASDLEGAWSGPSGSGAVLEVIRHTGEPVPDVPEPAPADAA